MESDALVSPGGRPDLSCDPCPLSIITNDWEHNSQRDQTTSSGKQAVITTLNASPRSGHKISLLRGLFPLTPCHPVRPRYPRARPWPGAHHSYSFPLAVVTRTARNRTWFPPNRFGFASFRRIRICLPMVWKVLVWVLYFVVARNKAFMGLNQDVSVWISIFL